jgi:hypothetical protein
VQEYTEDVGSRDMSRELLDDLRSATSLGSIRGFISRILRCAAAGRIFPPCQVLGHYLLKREQDDAPEDGVVVWAGCVSP